jgi:hypothetical protein
VREEKAGSGAVDDGWTLFMTSTTAPRGGLPDMHPHQLQHAFVTSWRAGGNENEVMLVVERIRTMIDRDTKPESTDAGVLGGLERLWDRSEEVVGVLQA